MIELIPVGSVDIDLMKDICKGIKNVFRQCGLTEKPLAVPSEAYDPSRDQYDAVPFLELLKEYALSKNAEKVHGVTAVDIYSQNMNFIFGQAFVGGQASLVSIHRLDQRYHGGVYDHRLFLERCVKETVHEIGHSYGLGHCDDRDCVMVFSNNISEVDAKSARFCQKCNTLLTEVLG